MTLAETARQQALADFRICIRRDGTLSQDLQLAVATRLPM